MDVDATIEERLDDAYERTGPPDAVHGPGFANHGPMAAEALVAMGGQRHLEGFVQHYASRLVPRPNADRAIVDPEAELGSTRRFADWAVYFADEIDQASWRDVVGVWLPRLLPGYAAAAGHGLLRVAHILRAIDRHDTDVRRREIADALGYWASSFTVLTGPDPSGVLGVDEALAGVPRLADDADRDGSITPLLVAGTNLDGWAEACAAVAPNTDVAARLDALALASVDAYLAYTPNSFTFIHGVTTTTMARVLLPYLGPDDQLRLGDAAWRYVAAAVAAFAPGGGAGSGPLVGQAAGRAGTVDLAAGTRDDHTIKFADACLSLAMRSASMAPLTALDDRVVRTS